MCASSLVHEVAAGLSKDTETQVLLRARVHTVRGKGKSAFLVLRQRHATIQVCSAEPSYVGHLSAH
jgi:aspartyl/asparaginyl-tRNA synthetase